VKKLTRLERAYLARHVCWLCDQRLDRDSCAAAFGPPCSRSQRHQRRMDCLKHYRPRRRTA
jgi:hypothetical protein